MTKFAPAAEGLFDEVCTLINSINPTKFSEIRFGRVAPEDKNSRAFSERTGRARLYQLDMDMPDWKKTDWVGAGTQGMTVEYPILIAYPTSPGWAEAMMDDFHQIQDKFWAQTTTVAGVALRTIVGGPKIRKNEADPWLVMALTLSVVYDLTTT